jgi:hypothetical protein
VLLQPLLWDAHDVMENAAIAIKAKMNKDFFIFVVFKSEKIAW